MAGFLISFLLCHDVILISMRLPKLKTNISGQVLLGILISLAVFAILLHAIFTLVASSFDLVNFNKARITARHLAQEKMELIRNLPYENVGTVGGIPAGIIEQEENIERNGLNYLIETSIIYIDDSFDNTAPTDTEPEDYKRIRVEVSWGGLAASRKNPIILITDISPGLTDSADGGMLRVLVFNANGNPVPQAQVIVIASSVSPSVNLTQNTDDDGVMSLPGAAACTECYEITVTKSEFSTDRTYSTSEVANPSKPHASVIDGAITQISFAIDEVGSINIASVNDRENDFASLANAAFTLRGEKEIGTDAFAQPVYKFDENFTTDSGGNITIPNLEWDNYQVLMPNPTSWDISGANPLLPLRLLPNGNLDSTISLTAHFDHSLFVTIKDTSQFLIASASARLYSGGFEEIKNTGESDDPDFGQVFFSNLEEKAYELEATASGYLDFNGSFDISGSSQEDVVLIPE
jgi:hypothetical protein